MTLLCNCWLPTVWFLTSKVLRNYSSQKICKQAKRSRAIWYSEVCLHKYQVSRKQVLGRALILNGSPGEVRRVHRRVHFAQHLDTLGVINIFFIYKPIISHYSGLDRIRARIICLSVLSPGCKKLHPPTYCTNLFWEGQPIRWAFT